MILYLAVAPGTWVQQTVVDLADQPAQTGLLNYLVVPLPAVDSHSSFLSDAHEASTQPPSDFSLSGSLLPHPENTESHLMRL